MELTDLEKARKARKAKKWVQDHIGEIAPGPVVGIGIGKKDGRHCVHIMLREPIPDGVVPVTHIQGVAVVWEVTGPMVLQ